MSLDERWQRALAELARRELRKRATDERDLDEDDPDPAPRVFATYLQSSDWTIVDPAKADLVKIVDERDGRCWFGHIGNGDSDAAKSAAADFAKDYEEDEHPRDEHGRWAPAPGGKKTKPPKERSRGRISEEAPPEAPPEAPLSENERGLSYHARWHAKIARSFAQKLGFPLDKIETSEERLPFSVGTMEGHAAGVADLETGQVTIFANPNNRIGKTQIHGIVAHEVAHVRYESVLNALKKEKQMVRAARRAGLEVSDRANYHLGTNAHVIKDDFAKDFPLLSRFQKFDDEQLMRDDGVSEYSAEYWSVVSKVEDEDFTAGYFYEGAEMAKHETIAEMARLRDVGEDKQRGDRPPSKLWQDYYDEVDKSFAELNRHGDTLYHEKLAAAAAVALAKGDYEEDEHPRGPGGKWTESGNKKKPSKGHPWVRHLKSEPGDQDEFRRANSAFKQLTRLPDSEFRTILRNPEERSAVLQFTVDLWKEWGEQRTFVRPLMKRVLAECKPGSPLAELHPGNITVYRGYGEHSKGPGGISSFSTSRKLAADFSRGHTNDRGEPIKGNVRSVEITAKDAALSFDRLKRTKWIKTDRYFLTEKEVVTSKAALLALLAKRELTRRGRTDEKEDVGLKVVLTLALHELAKRKRAKLRIDTHDAALNAHHVEQFQNAVASFLHTEGNRAAARVARLLGLQKAKKPPESGPSAEDVIEVAANVEWHELVAPAESSLFGAAAHGGSIGIGQLEISDVGLISAASENARAYAHERAAELVGMQWRGGKLVPNPNAKWRIDETTRNELRVLVERAFEQETPLEKLVEQVREAGAFSEGRAKTIGRTEIARAQSYGTLHIWQTMGTVKTVRWDMSADHDNRDGCDENHAAGAIPTGQLFPTGVPCPPDHPNCRCALVPVELNEE